MKRHPHLAERCAEPITRSRAALTEGCVRGWFKDARSFFHDKKIEYVLNNPERQYNGDETGFRLDPKTGKILGPKGEAIYSEAGGNKEQLSVLITTRADGKMMTSAIVYPYKKSIPKLIVDHLPKTGYCIAISDSGWMTSAIFFEYMANTFIPELSAIRRQDKGLGADDELILTDDDWVVYWIDGYASHLTYHTSLLCDLNHITLYCFKAHASHICQPNDVGPFKPLKNEWRKAVTEWRVQNPYATLNKVNFAAVLSVAVQKLDSSSIIAGYRSTGLYPFDEDALHYERLTATNQHKHDSEAFSSPQQELSANEIALNVIENILGSNIVSQFKQVQNSDVVDLSVIPSVHTYIIWKHLSELVQRSAVDQQLELNSYFPQSNEQNVLLLIPDLPSGDHWRPLEVDPVQPYPFPQVCVTSAVDDAIQQCLSTEPVVAEDAGPSVSSPSEAVQIEAAEPVVAEDAGPSVSSPSEAVQTEAAEPVVAEDPCPSVSSPSEAVQTEAAEPVVAEPVVAEDPGLSVFSPSEAVQTEAAEPVVTEPVVAEDPGPSVSSPSEAVQTQAAEPVVAEDPGLSVSSPSEAVQTEAAKPVVAEDPGLSVSRETAEPVVAEPVVAQDPGPLVSSTSETVQTEEAEPVRSTIELMKPTNGDVCLRDEKTLSPSNSKLKRGLPIWFSGKYHQRLINIFFGQVQRRNVESVIVN